MTTRAIVPNGDGEGSLGTASLKWGKVYSSDPASGENSGQVPTTAWVQSLVAKAVADAQKQAKLDAHPVGSYYFSDKSTSPADLFGGTWEALPAGYTLIAQGSGTDDFGSFNYVAGTKYGERMHKLTVDEMPVFAPTVYADPYYGVSRNDGGSWLQAMVKADKSDPAGTKYNYNIGYTGGDKAHQNVPPAWRHTVGKERLKQCVSIHKRQSMVEGCYGLCHRQ